MAADQPAGVVDFRLAEAFPGGPIRPGDVATGHGLRGGDAGGGHVDSPEVGREVRGGHVSEPVIQFEKVTKTYTLCQHIAGGIKTFLFHLPAAVRQLRNNKFTALDEVSFEVARGEALGVIGPNGAGKSTTLALIARVLQPNAGSITVRGRVLPLLELGAGFHPELTGRENIILNGVLMGLLRREVYAKLDQIIEFSELGEFIDQPVRTYSNGMLGRLGFSVVAHLDPEVLLVDEVLTVGDA
ncbi:MAG: hypothetical protein DRQ02_13425, partial [Candidatus Latescibacterota bacterium]